MRQYHYSFMTDRGILGISRAACSPDPFRIEQTDYEKYGYLLGLQSAAADSDPALAEANKELLDDCHHGYGGMSSGHGLQSITR